MKTKAMYILEAINKMEKTCTHLEELLTKDMYSVAPLLIEVKKHKEILERIYVNK